MRVVLDPIRNVDRLVLLLRQRLQDRARASGAAGERLGAVADPHQRVDQLQALASIETVDDRQVGRALIQSLLADHFGRDMLNDAGFQRVVDRVSETLEQDSSGSALLSQLVAELKRQAAP